MTAIYGLPSALGKQGFQPFLNCIVWQGFQPFLNCIGWQGNLLCLLGDSVLQLREDDVSHPSSYTRSSTGLGEVTDGGLLSFATNQIPC